MVYYRDPEVQAQYDARIDNDTDTCPFCELDPARTILEQTENYYIVANLMPYDLWDMHKVDEHLLLIPRSHVASLAELDKSVQAEIMDAVLRYEDKGYNIYARAAQNKTKSVVHQHTHVIKTSGPTLTRMNFTAEPYTRTLEFEE